MFRIITKAVLEKYINPYLPKDRGLVVEQHQIHVLDQNTIALELSDLEFDPVAINNALGADLPFSVKALFVGTLQLAIPFIPTKQATKITADSVLLKLQPRKGKQGL